MATSSWTPNDRSRTWCGSTQRSIASWSTRTARSSRRANRSSPTSSSRRTCGTFAPIESPPGHRPDAFAMRLIFPLTDPRHPEFYFSKPARCQEIVQMTEQVSAMLRRRGIEHTVEYRSASARAAPRPSRTSPYGIRDRGGHWPQRLGVTSARGPIPAAGGTARTKAPSAWAPGRRLGDLQPLLEQPERLPSLLEGDRVIGGTGLDRFVQELAGFRRIERSSTPCRGRRRSGSGGSSVPDGGPFAG